MTRSAETSVPSALHNLRARFIVQLDLNLNAEVLPTVFREPEPDPEALVRVREGMARLMGYRQTELWREPEPRSV